MTRYVFALALILFTSINISAQKTGVKFEDAKQLAQQNDKRIMLVFKGSDWCAPCIKLEREILHTDEFLKLSKEEFVTVIADFPRKKKNQLLNDMQAQNKSLAEKYNRNGYFPYIIILSSKGDVLGSVGYEKTTAKAYFDKINTFK